MKINNNYIELIKTIKENKILTWKEVAPDLGIAYQTILNIVNKKYNRQLSVKTKRKLIAYITRNEEYLD